MDKFLSGKTALVTGSSRGLGFAYAKALAGAGADVIITDRSETSANRFGEAASGHEVAEKIRAMGVKSAFYAADLREPEKVKQLVEKSLSEFGCIDILVNNAGGDIGAATPRPMKNNALDILDEDIFSVVERNLIATMLACKYVGQHMRSRKTGKIINISSGAGQISVKDGIIYAAAKRAIDHYTICLADEMRPFNVNVNCIAPLGTKTARFFATRQAPNEERLTRLQRLAEPEDMAEMVLFLAGPHSERLSGETIIFR